MQRCITYRQPCTLTATLGKDACFLYLIKTIGLGELNYYNLAEHYNRLIFSLARYNYNKRRLPLRVALTL